MVEHLKIHYLKNLPIIYFLQDGDQYQKTDQNFRRISSFLRHLNQYGHIVSFALFIGNQFANPYSYYQLINED